MYSDDESSTVHGGCSSNCSGFASIRLGRIEQGEADRDGYIAHSTALLLLFRASTLMKPKPSTKQRARARPKQRVVSPASTEPAAAPLTVGEMMRFLAPELDVSQLPIWPPDAFAVAAGVL